MENTMIKKVLEKYIEAEQMRPAFERVTFFSWNDMLCLKNEIDDLQADKKRLDWLSDTTNLIGNIYLPTECVVAHVEDMRAAIDAAMEMATNLETGKIR